MLLIFQNFDIKIYVCLNVKNVIKVYYNGYGFVINNKIKYGDLEYLYLTGPSDLPEKISPPKSVKYFEIDRINRIIYYLSDTRIHRIFYDSEISINKNKTDIFIEDFGIIGFKLDLKQNYMYFFTKESITVIDINTRIRRKIFSVNNKFKIYYLKLNFKLGLIVFAFKKINKKENYVKIIYINQKPLWEYIVHDFVNAVQIEDLNEIKIYFLNGGIKYNLKDNKGINVNYY